MSAPAAAPRAPGGAAWPLAAASFAQVADLQLLNLTLPEWSARLGGNAPALLVSYAIGAALVPAAVAWRWPRFSGAPALAVGAAGLALALAGFALAPNLGLAHLARFWAGAASGVVSFAGLALAAAHGSRAVTLHSAGFLAGMVLGPPAGAFVLSEVPLSGGWWALVTALVPLAWWALQLARRRPPEHRLPAGPASAASASGLGRDPLRVLLATALIGAGLAAPVGLLPSALADPSGAALDLQGRGLVMLAGAFGLALALPLTNTWLRLAGNASVARQAALLLAVALLAFGPASRAAWSAALGLGLAMLIETMRRSALQGLATQVVAPQALSRFLVARALLTQLGIAGGIALALPLASAFGFGSVALSGALLLVLGAWTVPPQQPSAAQAPPSR